jgi:hypothetical protein
MKRTLPVSRCDRDPRNLDGSQLPGCLGEAGELSLAASVAATGGLFAAHLRRSAIAEKNRALFVVADGRASRNELLTVKGANTKAVLPLEAPATPHSSLWGWPASQRDLKGLLPRQDLTSAVIGAIF